MDIENQNDWAKIIEESAYSVEGFAAMNGFKLATVRTWLRKKKPSKPRGEFRTKMVAALSKAIELKRTPKHPSFGYATQSQIDELGRIGVCPRQSEILLEIQEQSKRKGKIC